MDASMWLLSMLLAVGSVFFCGWAIYEDVRCGGDGPR